MMRRAGTALGFAAIVAGGVLLTQSYTASHTSGASVSFDAVSDTGTTSGAYAFFANVDGKPATWDRCIPIRVVFARSVVEAGVDDEARTALSDINNAGAFTLADAGIVDHEPTTAWSEERAAFGADVIVAVSTDAATDLLDGGAGLTTSTYSDGGGQPRYTSAAVLLDEDALEELASGMGAGSVGALLTHELLHVVGLDHVDDPSSIITKYMSDSSGAIGPGDRAGLDALAATAPCSPTPGTQP